MPRQPLRTLLAIPRGYRSTETAGYIGQLDDLTARLLRDLRGLSTRELQWQPGAGRNSIGMLLAHLAIVEVWWLGGPASGHTEVDFRRVIGITGDDDGMPAKPGSRHPRALRGKSLAFYRGLLRRSRPYVRRIARGWTARDLDRPMQRTWVSQKVEHHFNRRWVLYHVLEHFSGHYGQILLLKELMKKPARRNIAARKPRTTRRGGS